MAVVEWHQPVGRATCVSLAIMRPADIVLKRHPEFSDLKVFECERLHATITPATCSNNHARSEPHQACWKCPAGEHNRNAHAPSEKAAEFHHTNRHIRMAANAGFSCIRCGRTGSTEGSRLIGKLRLVSESTVCVSCFNRGAEVARGSNSKGAAPRKWAAMKPATVTILRNGKREKIDIGFRSSRPECERFVARVYPSAMLLTVTLGGELALPGAPENENYVPHSACKPKRSTDVQPRAVPWYQQAAEAELEAEDKLIQKPVTVPAPTIKAATTAREAKPETMRDFGFCSDAEDMADFVKWLSTDWPRNIHAPRKPVAEVADFGLGDDASGMPLSKLAKPEGPGNHVIMTEFNKIKDLPAFPQIMEKPGADTIEEIEEATTDDFEQPSTVIDLGPADRPTYTPGTHSLDLTPLPSSGINRAQRRAMEKAARKAKQKAARAAQRAPSRFAPLASTCRAFVQVMFEVGGRK